MACVVALSNGFDLDHIGAHVTQVLRTHRAGQHLGEVQHAQAGKRKFTHLNCFIASVVYSTVPYDTKRIWRGFEQNGIRIDKDYRMRITRLLRAKGELCVFLAFWVTDEKNRLAMSCTGWVAFALSSGQAQDTHQVCMIDVNLGMPSWPVHLLIPQIARAIFTGSHVRHSPG